MTTPRPFLKMVGGKTQLLPELLKRVPSSFDTYHEPFLGGGALFFALQPERAVLSDVNEELITTYQSVRDYPHAMLEILKHFEERHSNEYFYKIRKDLQKAPIFIAARMIYLNKTCFNGLYRVNKKGEFNVPLGSYKNPKICDEENLLACSKALQNVEIVCQDFRQAFKSVGANDFVFCDPPYYDTFTGYTGNGFTLADQRELAQLCEHKRCLITNSDTAEMEDLYRGFAVDHISERRSVNRSGKGRGKVGTLIVQTRMEL